MITMSAALNWASIFTAIGTVGAVAAALWIALWSDKRSGDRLADERAHSAKQLAQEQAFSRDQLQEERKIARDREQLAEAYAVQVAMGEQPAGGATGNVQRPIDDAVKVLSVMIVNKGSYTITRIEARFCTDGKNVISHHQFARLGAFDDLPRRLSEGFTRLEDDSGCGDVLAGRHRYALRV